MRVLLVSHRFPPDGIAGVERYTQSLAAELRRGGDTVAVAARDWAPVPPVPTTAREQLPDGTAVFRFVGGGAPGAQDFMRHRGRLELLFATAALEAEPDVVHVNHLLGLPPRLPEIARGLGAAVVLSLHDFFPVCPLAHLRKRGGELCHGPDGGRECAATCFADEPGGRVRWGLRATHFRQVLGMADRIVCHSRYVASYFEPHGIDPARARVIPHGVPPGLTTAAAAFRTPDRRQWLNLAYCGMVVPHKGPHVILEALRAARLGPVLLRLVGKTPDERPARRYLDDLRRQAAAVPGLRLEVPGAYEPCELPAILGDTDCVIVPSLVAETGGLVPRESLALGIPVLAARLRALPELVVDGGNGFTFDPHRPAELAALLRRLAADEGLLAQLRDGARRTPVVTAAQHAAAVRAVYTEALEEVRSGGRESDVLGLSTLHDTLARADEVFRRAANPVRKARSGT